MKLKTRYKFMLAAAAYAAVAIYTDDAYRLGSNCRPESEYAQLLMNWKGRRFWSQQLAKIDEEILAKSADLRMWQAMPQQLAIERREAQQLTASIYEKSPELRPSPQQAYVNLLRENADAIERIGAINSVILATSERVQSAQECRTIIQTHLAVVQ